MTRNVLVASGSDLNKVESLTLSEESLSRLRSKPPLYLTVKMLYRVTKAEGERGPWKVSTAAYAYGLHDKEQREIISYHWHPSVGRPYPHLHIGEAFGITHVLVKAHLPTGRVSLEEVLRLLIEELKVKPLRRDWDRVLRSTQSQYERFRSWPR